MAVRTSDIQAPSKLPGIGHTQRQPSGRSPTERSRAHIGFGLAGLLIVVGWLSRRYDYISAEEGLGYFLGIFAMTCMSGLLLYPLRKRVRILRFLGPLSKWFRTHMILGVLGPIAALYHCNFQLGSLNSRIALFSALIVAASGLVGRFIYTKIHHGLYGRKANLKELLAKVKLTGPATGLVGTYIPELMKRIEAFDRRVLVPPKGILESITLPLALAVKTRVQYLRLLRFSRRRLKLEAVLSPVVAEHQDRLEQATRRYVSNHLRHVRRVAEFTAYERLFSLWHKVHLPFFFMLVISTVIHVVVVHLY